eukprot:1140771-Pelagomonas_calceolata.AAC.3
MALVLQFCGHESFIKSHAFNVLPLICIKSHACKQHLQVIRTCQRVLAEASIRHAFKKVPSKWAFSFATDKLDIGIGQCCRALMLEICQWKGLCLYSMVKAPLFGEHDLYHARYCQVQGLRIASPSLLSLFSPHPLCQVAQCLFISHFTFIAYLLSAQSFLTSPSLLSLFSFHPTA